MVIQIVGTFFPGWYNRYRKWTTLYIRRYRSFSLGKPLAIRMKVKLIFALDLAPHELEFTLKHGRVTYP